MEGICDGGEAGCVVETPGVEALGVRWGLGGPLGVFVVGWVPALGHAVEPCGPCAGGAGGYGLRVASVPCV